MSHLQLPSKTGSPELLAKIQAAANIQPAQPHTAEDVWKRLDRIEALLTTILYHLEQPSLIRNPGYQTLFENSPSSEISPWPVSPPLTKAPSSSISESAKAPHKGQH